MNKRTKELVSFLAGVIILTLLGFWPTTPKTPPTINWGNLGVKMAEAGVIDRDKLESLYAYRGGLTEPEKKLLDDNKNENLIITSQNSRLALHLLWALGLSNNNPILENGPIRAERFGGLEDFASTGGWTLARGDPLNHFNRHEFITLTPEQQLVVERVSKNIFRPCCDNPTHFPDCNHGMAMLGLLELMASQGASEISMYKTALAVNALWFPNQYQTLRTFFGSKNIDWDSVDSQEILSAKFSSLSGYKKALLSIPSPEQSGKTGCGV